MDLLLAQDGDDTAFGRMVTSCDADIRRFCAWSGVPANDADDVVQETFLRAFRGLGSFRGDSTARSWLLTIARRVFLDFADRKAKDMKVVSHLVTSSLTVSNSVSADEAELVGLHDLVSRLPGEFREAFVLVRIFGFKYDEVSSIVGCPRGTVQSRVARARECLADLSDLVDHRQIS